MKNLILVLLVAVLTACNSGDSGSGSSGGSGNPGGPSCKSVYSLWQSDTDSEEFDFTGLENTVIEPDYSYEASNSATCGYPSNPNHNLTGQIIPGLVSDPYDYRLKMEATLIMSGTCSTYYETGSSGGGRYNAYIVEVGCNQLQICEDVVGSTVGNCKLFH